MNPVLHEIKQDKAIKLKAYKDKFEMSLNDWMQYHHSEIVMDQCSYMGVKTLKNPMDLWVYQEIIYSVKPDIILEIGSMYGGSTLYFAHILDSIGHGQVISVDIQRDYYQIAHERVIEITGDSASPEVVNKVHELCKDKTVFIIHDGDHSKVQVLKDLRAYAGLVSLNSYFVVEDTTNEFLSRNEQYEGPFEAVEEFLRESSDFIVDHTRERYLLTYAMNGFLKRIKVNNKTVETSACVMSKSLVSGNDLAPYLAVKYRMVVLSNYVKSNMNRLDYESQEILCDLGLNMYTLFKDVLDLSFGSISLQGNTAIYGSGAFCEVLVSTLNRYQDIFLTAIVEKDEAKHGSTMLGLPVISINDLERYEIRNILIASVAHGREIAKRLEYLRKEKNIRVIQLPLELLSIMNPNIEYAEELLNTYRIIASEMMSKEQLCVIIGMLEKVLRDNVDGDIVELGCNSGSTSLFIRRMLDHYQSDKKYHVYDSFEGLPEHTDYDIPHSGIQRFKGECHTTRDIFMRNFNEAGLVLPEIHQGWFKNIPDEKYPDKISFAFLDGDFYSSIIDSFEKVYHKLSSNAIVCIHDYRNRNLPGARKACDDFLHDKPEIVFEIDGIGYMVKM
ncbi:MAG: CmcI family methyltransferase [Candidatus Auribacterota bacterium]